MRIASSPTAAAFPADRRPPKEDICYATQNRQEAVRVLAAKLDLCLVLGSQNSSNSQRLKEIAAEAGIPGYLIDGPEDISREWFAGIRNCVGIGRSQRSGTDRRSAA